MHCIRYANGEFVTEPDTSEKVIFPDGVNPQEFAMGMELAIRAFCPKTQKLVLPLSIYLDAPSIREQYEKADANMRKEEGRSHDEVVERG